MMHLRRVPHSVGRRQRGVSIFMAIFLLLLFGLVSALIATLISTANVSQAQDIEGARAYQAARAGVEWGMSQPELDPNAASLILPDCFSPNPKALTAISGYSVEVRCTRYQNGASPYQEGSKTIRMFLLTARAVSTSATPPGIERLVEVTIEKCRDSSIASPPYDC